MNQEGEMMIDIRELEKGALELFSECPKHTTIVRHADREEVTGLHCVLATTPFVGPLRPHDKRPTQRDFLVPKQELIMVKDPTYGLFSVIRVSEKADGPEHALFTSVRSRLGFLLPLDKLPSELVGLRAKV